MCGCTCAVESGIARLTSALFRALCADATVPPSLARSIGSGASPTWQQELGYRPRVSTAAFDAAEALVTALQHHSGAPPAVSASLLRAILHITHNIPELSSVTVAVWDVMLTQVGSTVARGAPRSSVAGFELAVPLPVVAAAWLCVTTGLQGWGYLLRSCCNTCTARDVFGCCVRCWCAVSMLDPL